MSNDFVDYVMELLGPFGTVGARRMFGGHGLYLHGSFFGIAHKGALYLRTDDVSRKRYVKAGSRPFNPKGKRELHRYYEVPAEVLDDAETLVDWALEAAQREV